jgi:mitochondrial GTPase 1
MPNVGKSTLINHMRGHCRGRRSADATRKVAKVGPKPGVTRGLESFRIAEPPHPLYMVDTPGVMVPRIDSAAVGLRLALTAAVPDSAGMVVTC